jgi:hypothetical protein
MWNRSRVPFDCLAFFLSFTDVAGTASYLRLAGGEGSICLSMALSDVRGRVRIFRERLTWIGLLTHFRASIKLFPVDPLALVVMLREERRDGVAGLLADMSEGDHRQRLVDMCFIAIEIQSRE